MTTKPNLSDLIRFIERHAIDEQLYWRIPQLYSDREFELQWQRGEDRPWRFRSVGGLFWQTAKSIDLITTLSEARLDLQLVEDNMLNAIMQQIIYADMILKDARELFGAERIEQAIRDNGRFLSDLERVIASLVTPSPESSHEAQRPATDDAQPKTGLKLVTGNRAAPNANS